MNKNKIISIILEDGNKIDVFKSVERYDRLNQKKNIYKTYIINNNIILKPGARIFYKCDICGKINKRKTNIDFFENNKWVCGECKKKQTNLEKYGVEYIIHTKQSKENKIKIFKKKYGVDNPSKIEYVKEKKKRIFMEKYGVENPFQIKKVKDKIKQTNLKRYGHDYYNQALDSKLKNKKNRLIKYYENLDYIKLGVTPLFNVDEFKGTKKNYYKWKCNVCGNEFVDNLANGRIPRCIQCNPLTQSISHIEKEISLFIKSLNLIIVENDRVLLNGKELDIYIPSHNLAIEFDGLYWHSDIYKNKNYHLNKTLACNKQGIQLIHIFENEWLYKQDIVKARIKNILGFNEHRIGARKCKIKEIEAKEKNIFLNTYHLQGEDRSAIKLGAFYENELIGVMTFSKPRISLGQKYKKGKWELSRFATVSNTYTPGLASKMLKYFENNWEWVEIYSYADRRWSIGGLYGKIGFEFDGYSKPNYWYTKSHDLTLKHRYNYRKSNLKKFENYDENKTEFEIMDEAGYCRIWDCGNYKFIKSK